MFERFIVDARDFGVFLCEFFWFFSAHLFALKVIMDLSSPSPIVFETPGYTRIYKDGMVERLVDKETVPPF